MISSHDIMSIVKMLGPLKRSNLPRPPNPYATGISDDQPVSGQECLLLISMTSLEMCFGTKQRIQNRLGEN